MSVIDSIQSDVKDAMRARDTDRVTALRMLVDSLQKEAKEKLRELTDTEEIQVLSRERKKRAEAYEAYAGGGADDRAAIEKAQMEMIDAYLPAQLSEAEIGELVDAAIAEAGASTPKDMGAVMKIVSPKIAGRADGKVVSTLVRERLAGSAE